MEPEQFEISTRDILPDDQPLPDQSVNPTATESNQDGAQANQEPIDTK